MPIQILRCATRAELRLCSPPRNLLDGELLGELVAALDCLARDGAPPLLLSAEGRHFSTGYPIDEIPEEIFHADPAVRAASLFERAMAALSAYPSVVVAQMRGDAYGGAVELLCCADLRVGVPDLRIGLPAVRLGLIYSLSGIRRLQQSFGAPVAREMLLTGEPLSARRAYRAGFLCRLASPERLSQCSDSLLAAIGAGAPLALRGTRRAIDALAQAEALPAELLAELAEQRHESWRSEDFREAQLAFIEKRRPAFLGR